jgi:hypothetical protein
MDRFLYILGEIILGAMECFVLAAFLSAVLFFAYGYSEGIIR